MRITEQRKSLEACTESGWDAIDFLTEEPLTDEDIESLRQKDGSFLYLRSLKKPFFKIESHNYVIKGVRGDSFFRFAAHRDHMDLAEQIRKEFETEQPRRDAEVHEKTTRKDGSESALHIREK